MLAKRLSFLSCGCGFGIIYARNFTEKQMKTETGRGAQCLKMMAMLAAVAAAAVAHGDGSYTWAGGTSGNWDSDRKSVV